VISGAVSSELNVAVFLDRDGTVIEDRGRLPDPSEAVSFPGTVEALSRPQQRFLQFVVTNQPGIGDGLITGHGNEHPDEVPRGTVVKRGIAQAADWILERND